MTHQPNAMCGLCLDPDSNKPSLKNKPKQNKKSCASWGNFHNDGISDDLKELWLGVLLGVTETLWFLLLMLFCF